MSGSTTELALATAVDSDDNADYLTINLANSLRTLDALFNNVTGHNHASAHQGAPVAPAAGSITSGMIADGTIVAADIADGTITSAKIADGTITGTDIAMPLTIDTLVVTNTAQAYGLYVLRSAVGYGGPLFDAGIAAMNVGANAGGTQGITFHKAFVVAPVVVISISASSNGQPTSLFIQATNISLTGFTVSFWNSTAASVTITHQWMAFGADH